MILQQYDDDIKIVLSAPHIEKVWTGIKDGYPGFLARLLEPDDRQLEELSKIAPVSRKGAGTPALQLDFQKALKNFENNSAHYNDFFDSETFEEFQDSKNSFKPELGRKCPIMRHTLNSKSSELLEWRKRYNTTPSTELLDVFANVLDFKEEFVESTSRSTFAAADTMDEIDFTTVEDDEQCRINGVIGMGIKSDVLHHLDPSYFPARDRRSLLGFYILSDYFDFGLPSKSSEFIMYDPERTFKNGSIYSSHCFWYPYALFTLYSLRLYRLLKNDLRDQGIALDDEFRFVYTGCFLKRVCTLEQDKILSFLARDVIGDYDDE